jgi:hypothetical protein
MLNSTPQPERNRFEESQLRSNYLRDRMILPEKSATFRDHLEAPQQSARLARA